MFLKPVSKKIEKKEQKKLEKRCQALWHQIVIHRSGGACEAKVANTCTGRAYCGHHFFTVKAHPSVRFDLRNGIAVCKPCHFKIHNRDENERCRQVIVGRIGQMAFTALYSLSARRTWTNLNHIKRIFEKRLSCQIK